MLEQNNISSYNYWDDSYYEIMVKLNSGSIAQLTKELGWTPKVSSSTPRGAKICLMAKPISNLENLLKEGEEKKHDDES